MSEFVFIYFLKMFGGPMSFCGTTDIPDFGLDTCLPPHPVSVPHMRVSVDVVEVFLKEFH